MAITAYWNIPNKLASLTNLEYLDFSSLDESAMSGSGSIGPIPAFIGSFSKLKTLKIHRAGATGGIPGSLGNLSDLEILDLSLNQLTGIIPAAIGALTALNTLNLSYNQLGGIIPPLGGIPVAASVDISNNEFTFDGMEINSAVLDFYSPQASIPLMQIDGSFPLPSLMVNPSSNTNNIYKLYRSGTLIRTTNENVFNFVPEKLTYQVIVTNSLLPNLILYSDQLYVGSLPVTLTSFNAISKLNENVLSWNTSAEAGNAGFEVEKSKDAINFEKIGFVDGHGNTDQNNNYTFIDGSPLFTSYYRLKQIDFDGTFDYSRIIFVEQKKQFAIYPNPVSAEFFVRGLKKKERVIIRYPNGNKVFDQNVSATDAINTSKLSAGLYLITIGNETYRVVVSQ